MEEKYLSLEQTEDYLQSTLDELHKEAEANRSSFNVGKTAGLFGMVASAVGCIALPAAGLITVGVSFGLYVGSLLSEAGTTGEITPVPFCSTRMSSLAIGMLQESAGISDADLELSDYLPKRDRILYLLLLTQGERMAKVLSQLPVHRWKPTLEGEISKINRVLAHGGSKLDYLTATQQGAEMVDYVEKNLNMPVSREIPQVQPTAQPQLIGSNTRLNALETAYATVDEPLDDVWAETPKQTVEVARVETQVKPQVKINALNSILADPFESRAFFGAQRTGKSYLAAVASAEMAERGTNVYHINLASYTDSETGINEDHNYWSHAKRSLCADLSMADNVEALTAIREAIEIVLEFFDDKGKSLLVFDEIAYVGSSTNQWKGALEPLVTLLADKITTLSSSGKKRKKAVWTIAPEFVATMMEDAAKAVKKLKLCYVTIAPNRFVDWDGQQIGFNDELFSQVKRNFEAVTMPSFSTVPGEDRICLINKMWMPVGELKTLAKV